MWVIVFLQSLLPATWVLIATSTFLSIQFHNCLIKFSPSFLCKGKQFILFEIWDFLISDCIKKVYVVAGVKANIELADWILIDFVFPLFMMKTLKPKLSKFIFLVIRALFSRFPHFLWRLLKVFYCYFWHWNIFASFPFPCRRYQQRKFLFEPFPAKMGLVNHELYFCGPFFFNNLPLFLCSVC